MANDLTTKTKTPRISLTGNKAGEVKMTLEQSRALSGSDTEEIPNTLMNQLINTIPGMSQDEKGERMANAAFAMLIEIGPRDGLEGMLAAQMVCIHNLSLECARRAMLPDQAPDGVNYNINRVTKLMRTFTAQMDALQRYRNGGKQTIKVQHVNVESGGQAIVGDVRGGGHG